MTMAVHLTGATVFAACGGDTSGSGGSGSAESCPHASQKRPVTGIPHAGQALAGLLVLEVDGAAHAGQAFASAAGDGSGCAAEVAIGAPHTSQ